MIFFNRETRSADQFYAVARARWVKAVNLDIDDNEDMIRSVVGLLKKARQQNGHHIQSLILLSDLLMVAGADNEAMEVVDSLLLLQPDNYAHVSKKALLQELQESPSEDTRNLALEFLKTKWTQTHDW